MPLGCVLFVGTLGNINPSRNSISTHATAAETARPSNVAIKATESLLGKEYRVGGGEVKSPNT